MHRVALSFLAHPDDAEFLCAGTLARLAQLGWELHIATVARGDCGTMTMSADECARTRFAEGTNAAGVIGATYHCLGEGDALVVYDKPTLRKAIDLFRRVTPSLVFTHAPRDYMMDHEKVSELARAASFIYPAPNASGLPRHREAAVPAMYYCDPMEGRDPLTGREVTPTTLVDVTSVVETKKAMLAAHASQREWLRAHHGMDEYVESMLRHAGQRGGELDVAYAEAFVQHRGHGYPHEDLLARLLGGKIVA